jgi:hypothetical protein
MFCSIASSSKDSIWNATLPSSNLFCYIAFERFVCYVVFRNVVVITHGLNILYFWGSIFES